jgi:signal transduction histidine kinase
MDVATSNIIASLLNQGGSAALHVDGSLRIQAVYNASLVESWLEQATGSASALATELAETLQQLFPAALAAPLLLRLDDIIGDAQCAIHDLGVVPARGPRLGAASRQLGVSAQRLVSATGVELLLLLRDVTAAQELQVAATRALAAADTSLALLRAEPVAMRLFLESAQASVTALRATHRMPARSVEALRDKLARLQAGAAQLAQESRAIELAGVAESCGRLLEALEQLQRSAAISGNDLLPLALYIDRIAHAVGNAWRCEEQRYCEPQPAAKAPAAAEPRRSRKSANWPQASERRWNQFLRRRGEEIGTLAKLTISGAELVPPSIRRDIDEILQHLLRNALEHGIETPEQRLTADKPAAGQISVIFADKGAAGLRIIIRDDGRGFDLQRIGKAAVKCGLISEESLLERDAVDLVGFIFKPAFTTAGLGDSDGHGRGMTCLRNTVTRLNGQVSVATKAGRYTQFTLQLPAAVPLQGEHAPTGA